MNLDHADHEFIDLDRTFHELSKYARENDDVDLSRVFHVGERLHWNNILEEFRVVILSEAGSGKTLEIRNQATQLRAQGKAAFFLRLEHIPEDFDGAFEVGSLEEFQDWIGSNHDGWLLLDSVDEARLHDPSDFERAIRILGKKIGLAKERAHIFITGRTFAWRPKTDLILCARHLPITRAVVKEAADQADADDDDQPRQKRETQDKSTADVAPAFKIVALDDLSAKQIETFAQARGIENTKDFLAAIERADAQTFTARPQDLRDVVDFWLDRHRIGTRFELMQNSIERRLIERDQSRAEVRPLSTERIREGVRLIAAATTLAKQPTIRVPDGADNKTGIPVGAVLPAWNEKDQAALLSRPIFDEAIYGAVRFHHRSVREYLTAEWLTGLLRSETSRRAVEALIFRNQYGIEVVTPTLRPVLPWLAILDEKIREKLLRIAPEVILEGGDPSHLPLETRRRILHEVCEKLASGTSGRSMADYSAVQRFSNPDLTDDVRALLRKYSGDEELTSFLLRMVWLGQLEQALPEAKTVALSPVASRYNRIAAFRAVMAVGSPKDMEDIRQSFTGESEELSRDWLGELTENLEPTAQGIDWLLASLAKTPSKERYSVDELSKGVLSLIGRTGLELLPQFIAGALRLLDEPPVIERHHCEISQKFFWLLEAAALAVQRLIENKSSDAFATETLEVVRKLRMARHYLDGEVRAAHGPLQKLIPEWPELNRALFWLSVENSRRKLREEKNERLTDFWDAGAWDAYWKFGEDDFDYIAGEIESRPFQDDKLVALSLAFHLYRNGTRPRTWRERLKRLVKGNAELSDRLNLYLKPPAASDSAKKSKHQQASWKRRADERARTEAKNKAEWKRQLALHIDKLRDAGFDDPRAVSHHQWYLQEETRHDGGLTRWTSGNWQQLVPEFGEDIARAFRDGAVTFWRKSDPVLRSEGEEEHQTPHSVIFGLTGLEIEAQESPEWTKGLSKSEVLRACRYAAFELNGFPKWFPNLFAAHPEPVIDFLVGQIEFELSVATPEKSRNDILSAVSWSGQWAWPLLGPHVARILADTEPVNLENLGQLLTILQGSSLSDEAIATLAENKAKSLPDIDHQARWYAVWVGVAPNTAITELRRRLDQLPVQDRTPFAMTFITNLTGGRRSHRSAARSVFETPAHLKSLYLLMHTHIRRSDDIERAGTGVYSPELRDDAQDARNALFEALNKIPGKEAFLALAQISTDHPDETSRPWFAHLTKVKAQQDADLDVWSPSQVCDFHGKFERTPSNHRELAELAVLRVLDLKDDLEHGDASLAGILLKGATLETEMRLYIGRELSEKAFGRYSVPQEAELADAKRPDLRFLGAGFDGPVPVELKLADNWSGAALFERLENQLCGDYLRDNRSNRGIFGLVYRGEKKAWDLTGPTKRVDFEGLVEALQAHWQAISSKYPGVEEITVVGIDLTKRTK